jgi:hypothetical protein
MADFCERDDELSGSIKGGRFLISWVNINFPNVTLHHEINVILLSGWLMFQLRLGIDSGKNMIVGTIPYFGWLFLGLYYYSVSGEGVL